MRDTEAYTGLWYAIHCTPLGEWRAAAALQTIEGVRVFLPEVRRSHQGRIQRSPFFPRYLFIRADLQTVSTGKINATPGVARLVVSEGAPIAVEPEVITALVERLEQINAQGGVVTHGFKPGDPVRLRSGPLRGLDAVFQGPMTPSLRVRVLLEFLGREQEVEVGVEALEPGSPRVAEDAGAARGELRRTTRGRGRPIRGREARRV